MHTHKITQGLVIATSVLTLNASFVTFAANVPAETKLASVQELVRGNGAEISSLDPDKTQGIAESNVIRDVLEGLVNQDANGNIVPAVALTWENKNNTTFIFHLRHDAIWSNGEPVTANDFVYSFERAVDPATASPYSWYFELAAIKNAAAIIAGKKDKSTLGVQAVDPYTLKVDLNKPLPYFVKMMAHTTTKPVNKTAIEKWGNQWTKPEHFVGNGAYLPEKWVINERLVLKRNHKYWDDKHTVINKVTYLPIENYVSEMNRFLSGEIDMTYELPIEQFKKLKKEHPEDISVVGNLCTYYYAFNTQKKPFDDVRVRKALSYTIDRNVISNAILGQGQKPAYFFTPEITAGFTPTMPPYAKMSQQQRDEKARELLADAGYSKSHPLSFKLLYNTNSNNKKIATVVQSMWKRALGVNAILDNQEWKTYLDTTNAGNFQVTRASWCADYNEASSFLSLFQSNNTVDSSHYNSKTYDAILAKTVTATSEKERAALYQHAETQLAQDMPIAPVYQYVKARLLSPHVGGFPANNAEDKVYAKDLYIKAE